MWTAAPILAHIFPKNMPRSFLRSRPPFVSVPPIPCSPDVKIIAGLRAFFPRHIPRKSRGGSRGGCEAPKKLWLTGAKPVFFTSVEDPLSIGSASLTLRSCFPWERSRKGRRGRRESRGSFFEVNDGKERERETGERRELKGLISKLSFGLRSGGVSAFPPLLPHV